MKLVKGIAITLCTCLVIWLWQNWDQFKTTTYPIIRTETFRSGNEVTTYKITYYKDSTIHEKRTVDTTTNRLLEIYKSNRYKTEGYPSNISSSRGFSCDTTIYDKPISYVNRDTVVDYNYRVSTGTHFRNGRDTGSFYWINIRTGMQTSLEQADSLAKMLEPIAKDRKNLALFTKKEAIISEHITMYPIYDWSKDSLLKFHYKNYAVIDKRDSIYLSTRIDFGSEYWRH